MPSSTFRDALYIAADSLRVIAELIRPFMPGTAERTLRMLGTFVRRYPKSGYCDNALW